MLEDTIRMIACGLAGWRVAWLLIYDDGPWAVFARLRARVGVGRPGEVTWLAQLFSCPWCLTIWTATAAWFLWALHPWLVLIPAGWAIAILSHRYAERD